MVILGGGGVACDIAKFLLRRQPRTATSEAWLSSQDVERLVGPLGPLVVADRQITIAQRSSKKIGYRLGRTTRWITIDQLEAAGVRMMRSAVLTRSDGESLLFRTPVGQERIAARTLVMATGQRPAVDALQDSLAAAHVACTVVGAAASTNSEPASISSSIGSGYAFAMAFGVQR